MISFERLRFGIVPLLAGLLCLAGTPAAGRAGDEIFGPQQCSHRSGRPNSAQFDFSVANSGRGFVLQLSAGGWRKRDAAPSATVTVELNGARIVLRRKFTRRRSALEIPVALRDSNSMTVRMRGAACVLTVQVVPIVVIDSPTGGQRVSADAISVSGHLNRPVTKLSVNGVPGAVNDRSFSAEAVPLAEGPNVLTVVSLGADGVAGSDRVEIERDTAAPVIALESPADGAIVTTDTISVAGSVDDPAAAVSVNGTPVALSDSRFALDGVELALGANAILVEAADALGNTSSISITVTRELPFPTAALSVSEERIAAGGSAVLSWTTGATTRVVIEPGIGDVAAVGSTTVAPAVTTTFTLTAVGARGVVGAQATVTVLGSPEPQPEGSFGAGYQSLVPEDATIGAYDSRRFAIVTGSVTDRAGAPLSGVGITVSGRADYGTAQSDQDGRFSLPVEGGGGLTLVYRKPGHIPAHRQVEPRWGEVVVAETVALIQQDAQGTAIALDGDPRHVFVHQASIVSDDSGTRGATIVIAGDTRVHALTEAGEVEITSFTLRATEFTTPEQMPAALPPASAFTYCVDISIDGADRVRFSKPVTVWVDNFLGFDVGVAVPAGYYDARRAAWVAAPDGRVVALLDQDFDGVVDSLDADGDGIADDLNADGSTADEVAGLADSARYAPGATFWRVDVAHLTPWDFNWAWSFDLKDTPPNPWTRPFLDEKRANDTCQQTDSFVECQGRIYHEELPIAGTDLTLHYSSARVPGYQTVINVPASGATVPERLLYIEVVLTIAGRVYTRTLPPLPNQIATFTWDGKDHLGNTLNGIIPATVKIGFAYQPVYYATRVAFASSFGGAGMSMVVTSIPLRWTVFSWQVDQLQLSRDAMEGAEFGMGWTLSPHHRTSTSNPGALFKGDGSTDRQQTPLASVFFGTWYGDSSDSCPPWLQMPICHPLGLVSDASGNLYVADQGHHRVVRIDSQGVMSVYAGTGTAGFSGDGGPATQARLTSPTDLALDRDGNLYLMDTGNRRLRKVDTSGTITTIAGSGSSTGIGGRMPALEKPLFTSPYGGGALAVDRWGVIYIAGGNASEVLRLGTDGMIETIVGYPTVKYPLGVAADDAGNLYIADTERSRVLKRDVNGVISVFAGGAPGANTGNGGPAVLAGVAKPTNLMVDRGGNVFISTSGWPGIVRKVDPSGTISMVSGDGSVPSGSGFPATTFGISDPKGLAMTAEGALYVANRRHNVIVKIAAAGARAAPPGYEGQLVADDSGEGYVFDWRGRHSATIDLESGVALARFDYIDARLASVTDRFANAVLVERDGDGSPTAVIAPNGQKTRLSIDANRLLREVAYPDGTAYSFAYGTGGLLTDEWDPRRSHFERTFDETGRIADVFDPAGGHWSWLQSIDWQGWVQTIKESAEGDAAVYRELTDRTGLSTSLRIAPDGSESSLSWTADRLNLRSAPACRETTETKYTTDPVLKTRMPAALSQTSPSGLKREAVFERVHQDAGGDQRQELTTETTRINGRAWTSVQDVVAGTLTFTSPAGRSVAGSFDPQKLLVKEVVIPGLLPTQFAYDARGRLVGSTQGDRSMRIDWDVNGNPARVLSPDGAIRDFVYDAMGRLVREVGPGETAVDYQYDANGNLTVVTNPNRVAYGFDFTVSDQRSLMSAPLSGDTVYRHDRDRRLTSVTLPSGRTGAATYAQGHLAGRQSEDGQVAYEYACGGRLSTATSGAEKVAYSYDGSLVTGDARTGTIEATIGYAWNDDFALSSMSYAGATSAYEYDADGLLIAAGGYAIGRNAGNGFPETVAGGGLTQVRTFNGYGELDSVTSSVGDGPAVSWEVLQRDGAGRVRRRQETLAGVAQVWEYAYDAAGRLTEVTRDDEVVERYTHDANGNRVTEMNGLRGIAGRSCTSSLEDHLLAAGDDSWRYDVDGYLQSSTDGAGTTTYQYSTRGELLRVERPDGIVLTYIHDPLGRRIAKQVDGTTVEKYLWAGRTRLLAVYDGSNALLQRYEYADSRMPVSMTAGGATYVLLTDQVGTLRAVADATGNVVKRVDYDSFGNIVADTNPSLQVPFGFAGGLHDRDTGLVRFGFRDYDPSMGRWTAKDPIDFAGGDTNLYAYTMSDPINLTDPSGLYESLPHYIVARDEALRAGMPRSLAEIVGRASGGVDTLHDPMRVENKAFHFSDYQDIQARFDAASTLFQLGEAIHALMDTYTHEGHNPVRSGIEHLWQSRQLDAWDPNSERDGIMAVDVGTSIRAWMRAHSRCR